MKCRLCNVEGSSQTIRASHVFGGEEKHNFWQCAKCDAIYLHPPLTDSEEKYFYKKEFDKVIYLKIILFFTMINFILPQMYLNTNTNYTSTDKLHHDIKELKLYSDYNITPDLIWNLNKKVKKLELSKINDSIFALISNENFDATNINIIENKLIINKKIELDFNTTTEESDRYKYRLATNFYILSRK